LPSTRANNILGLNPKSEGRRPKEGRNPRSELQAY
jgi:hypothetical protein